MILGVDIGATKTRLARFEGVELVKKRKDPHSARPRTLLEGPEGAHRGIR